MGYPSPIRSFDREEDSSRKNPGQKHHPKKHRRSTTERKGATWRDNRPFTGGQVMGKARMGKERALHL